MKCPNCRSTNVGVIGTEAICHTCGWHWRAHRFIRWLYEVAR